MADRDPRQRDLYLTAALHDIPRLLGAIDRNPYRPTYGCLDRQFWHYRTAAFPSEMYQEGVLPLALVYARPLPGNRWHGAPRVRKLAVAALRFSARSAHADGSCDDYYPFERALGAAVFSLLASARAYHVLQLDDSEIRAALIRRARWIADHHESGRLSNHHALAALGLREVARITGQDEFRRMADERLQGVLGWQSDEGWFDEYGGADPGYQTLTLDCLVQYRRLANDARLDEPIRRGLRFARAFLHPDDSFAGEYGSRGTYHMFPHGMELLAAEQADAADLADAHLRSLASGRAASFADDRMFAHRTANLIEAWCDWSPQRPPPAERPAQERTWFPSAGLLVERRGDRHTVVSSARGGVFKHFAAAQPTTDTGLILETTDGRIALANLHDRSRATEIRADGLRVQGALHWVRFETVSVAKQILLHAVMSTVGRWFRTLIRRLLQRRLITGRRACPVSLVREIQFLPADGATGPSLRVIDTIELLDPKLRVRRMAFGVDHESAYVAATGVYQESVLRPWTDLAEHVDELNSRRRVSVTRQFD